MTHPITKALCLVAAFVGGGTFSQYPEFAQQYTQRLAGQVDALLVVVDDFDRSALQAGLTRTQALDQLAGTTFLDARRTDMVQTFYRHSMMSASLAQLRAADGISRLTLIHRMNDRETLQNTWGDFQPAVPATQAGVVSAGLGAVIGWLCVFLLLGPLKLFRKRFRKSPTGRARHDPPLQRPTHYHTAAPRLMGETRP